MPTVRPRTTIYLWEFLLQLLDGEESCAAISWVNRERGEFVLKDQSEIAKLWGRVKGRPRMDKIKLGRAMRYYYKKKLLAKVPRRKAVYRFTKFDYLKQKQSEIIRHEDFPEVDFSGNQILDLINDDKSEGESVAPEVDGDDDDTPLESLLAERNREVFQEEKCQKLPPMEANLDPYGSMDNINESVCSFYDYGNHTTNFTCPNDDYNVPCSDIEPNDQYRRESYPTYIKNGAYETMNYNMPQYYYPSIDCNNNYPQVDVETGGHLASLLLNSILMSDQQIHESRENFNTIPVPCTSTSGNGTPEAILSPTLAQMKSEALTNNLTQQADDTNSTWNTLKEFERLLMINRSF
ncbi:uncharacterized protein LOC114533476 [Dendronephthya gigantea]|uniref:uncharacterized protein LOC114533476 n=1 Tax=Dendronephthya gigantea TaxID=151771 RepID=UPI00106A03C2|nr:uncharacterized protein LOC114533476 [Dendronephthya gigantea]